MGNFNYIDFVTTQKHELSDKFIVNLILEHLTKDCLNNNIILEGQLDEGIKDFAQKIKNKIKGSKLADFGKLVKSLKDSRKPKKVMSFLTSLKNAKIDLSNRKELLAAISIIAGTTDLNEETVPKEVYDATAKKLGPSLNSLRKFFKDNALGRILKVLFVAAPIYFSLSNELGDTMQALGADVDGSNPIAMVTDFEAGFDGNAADYEDVVQTYGPERSFTGDDSGDQGGGADIDPGELKTDTAEIEDAKSQGLELNTTGDETANVIKFNNGESDLDDGDKQKLASENSTIIDYLQNGLDYLEVIVGVSSNTGGNADLDNKGGSVSENRANNTADYILDNLESQLNEEGIEYERTGNTIKVEGGGTYTLEVGPANDPGTLNSIDKTNDTATQAAWRVGAVDGVIANLLKIFGFDPIEKEAPPELKPLAPVSVEEFSGLIRDAQWAVIMAVINPEANIFPYLNDDGSSEVKGGYTQGNFTAGSNSYLLDDAPENIKKLARGLVGARKGPDKPLNKIGDILGIEFEPRARAVFNVAGAEAGKGQERPSVSENIPHPFKDLLSEAESDLLDDFFIDSNIKNNASNIIAKLGSMYARKGDYLGIIDPEKLDSKTQKELKDFGFTQITTGRDSGKYIFLDDPEDAKAVSAAGDTKLTPDVDRVKKTMDRQPTLKNLFNRINTKKELEELLFYMVDYVGPKFQEQKSQMKSALIRLSQDKNLEQKPLIRQALRAAANRIATDKKTSASTSTTSTTAGSDIEIDYTIPGSAIRESVLKSLIRQSIKEVIKEQQLEIPFPDDIQKDTENLLNIFKNNSTLQSQLDQINVLKEFEELIRELVINTALFKQK